tara:strand:- start:7 stop:678 length:672 start_codon:yes stop_codon:yes gene_type:complete
MSKTIVNIPNFEGFYCSWLDSEMDNVAQMESEYYAEEYNLSDEKKEEIKDDYFSQNYDELQVEICKTYIPHYFEAIEDEIDFELNASFESLTSPKYYNFETDRLFVEIDDIKITMLMNWIFNNKLEKLKEVVKDRFTRRDGYIPNYSNDLETWGDVDTWDYNQLGTALLVFVDEYADFNYTLHEYVSETIYNHIYSTLSDDMQEFLNKEYEKKEDAKAQLSLF